jgi:GTPase
MRTDPNDTPTRAVVAAVQLPGVSDVELAVSVNELRELAKTLGFEVVGTFVQKRASFDTTGYLGVGKRQEIRRFVEDGVPAADAAEDADSPEDASEDGVDYVVDEQAEAPPAAVPAPAKRTARSGAARAKEAARSAADEDTRHVDVVLVDHEISPSQARNLEIEVGCEVMDRTMVILEIFSRHARSRAARAQVEIARLGYMGPRLREAAKLAGPKGRQRSGTGGRGAGESHGELDRQKIRNRIMELQEEIARMDVERRTQRARRQEGSSIARVVLVGYTNAGKSTLMRALTDSDPLVANKLFATLDTTVRALHPPTVPRVLVSDTVGFIKNLPHDLVASFKSTLEEAAEASLLLHVVDASDPGFERQLQVTDEVLAEIGAQDQPRIRVFNKIDVVGDADAQTAQAAVLRARYPDCVVMSARRDADVAALHATIRAFFKKGLVEAELFLPWTQQNMRGEIFSTCEVLDERADGEGALLTVRGDPAVIESLCKRFGLPAGLRALLADGEPPKDAGEAQ